MKTVTMHQPSYLPWIGFFSKISNSDCFVVGDSVPYSKNSVTNRNKIRTKDGWCYLTVPVGKKYYGSDICNITLPIDEKWKENHWKTIQHYYIHAKFFGLYKDFFEGLYQKDFKYLWQINEEIILFLFRCFEIDVEIVKASELDLDPGLQKTDLIVACMKKVGADIYLSGPSGRNYLDFQQFTQNNIGLKFFEFQHPVYQQRYPGFEPAMAAVDLLFNVGPKSGEIIKTCGSVEDYK
jgi:hypothetical protein